MPSNSDQSVSASGLNPDWITAGRDAVRSAAELVLKDFSADMGEMSAKGRDLKTRADIASEQWIRERLRPTGLPVLGEEEAGLGAPPGQSFYWVVDPLDGTFNRSRGIPFAAVCLALCRDYDPLAGWIYDLFDQQLYAGGVSIDATREDTAIHVSAVARREDAVLATGFPVGRYYDEASLRRSLDRFRGFKKIRMIGSAAMSLALVADGRMDAYHEEGIYWWDVAAGLALVAAAGGCYTINRSDTWKMNITAWNGGFPPDSGGLKS